jgi:hypothetical protein
MADVQAKFDELKANVQKAIDDPSGLVPSAGPAALLAGWYAKSVAEKLGAFKADVEKLIAQIVSLAAALMEPLGKLGEVIGSAMKELEGTLKKLSKLPAEVGKMAAEIDSPDDIAKIDVETMKACLNVSGIDGPLTSIGGLGEMLGGAIGLVKEGVQMIMDFILSAAEQIKAAFTVPSPCCCCTGPAMAQAPQAFQDMMGMVDNLKKIDLTALLDMLAKTSDTVTGIDIELVKKPVMAFAEAAGGSVDKLKGKRWCATISTPQRTFRTFPRSSRKFETSC